MAKPSQAKYHKPCSIPCESHKNQHRADAKHQVAMDTIPAFRNQRRHRSACRKLDCLSFKNPSFTFA